MRKNNITQNTLDYHGKGTRIEKELLRAQGINNPLDSWRIFRILAEFVTGFEILCKYGKAVTFFGSSRCKIGDRVHKEAEDLASRLVKEGFTVITGGGPGVMEAANKGALEADGSSVGLNIQLPEKQAGNKYVTDSENFHYFFTRKLMLSFASEVYIFFPGGFGTMDEFFELVTLVQTKKIKRIPIVLVNKEYWEPLLGWIEHSLYEKYKAIDKEDIDIYYLVDSVDEAVELITKLVPNNHE